MWPYREAVFPMTYQLGQSREGMLDADANTSTAGETGSSEEVFQRRRYVPRPWKEQGRPARGGEGRSGCGDRMKLQAKRTLISWLCGVCTNHRDLNTSDGKIHYAYCRYCKRIFGNKWSGVAGRS